MKKEIIFLAIFVLFATPIFSAENKSDQSFYPTNSKQVNPESYLEELTKRIDNCIDSGRCDEALTWSRQAVEIAANLYGNTSVKKDQFLIKAGNVCFLLKKYQDAEPFFKESLDICEKIYPAGSNEIVNANKRLGGTYFLENKYELAKPLLENCLRIEEKLLGKNHQNNVSTRKYLSIIDQKLSEPITQIGIPIELQPKSEIGFYEILYGSGSDLTTKMTLVVIVIFIFFITIFGILKGSEGKTIFFSSRRDYIINLIFGVIFLLLIIFVLLIHVVSFKYIIIVLTVFFGASIIRSYYLNRGMIIIPCAVGFSRSIMMLFIPIIEFVAILCMRDESFIQKDGENALQRIKRLDANKSYFVQFGRLLLEFVCGSLINGVRVELFRSFQKADKTFEKMKESFKESVKSKKEADKVSDKEDDFKGSFKENMYDDIKKETSSKSYKEEEYINENSMEDLESPYQILGIAEGASVEEIKRAYKEKIVQYHPDKTGGLGEKLRVLAEEEAKKINSAYQKIMKSKEVS